MSGESPWGKEAVTGGEESDTLLERKKEEGGEERGQHAAEDLMGGGRGAEGDCQDKEGCGPRCALPDRRTY